MLRGALRSGIGLTMTGRSEQDSQGSPIRAQEALKAAHFSVGGWLKLALSIHPSIGVLDWPWRTDALVATHGGQAGSLAY